MTPRHSRSQHYICTNVDNIGGTSQKNSITNNIHKHEYLNICSSKIYLSRSIFFQLIKVILLFFSLSNNTHILHSQPFDYLGGRLTVVMRAKGTSYHASCLKEDSFTTLTHGMFVISICLNYPKTCCELQEH